MPSSEAHRLFEAHKVSAHAFSLRGGELYQSGELVARVGLGGALYPWTAVAPAMVGILAFGVKWDALVQPDMAAWLPELGWTPTDSSKGTPKKVRVRGTGGGTSTWSNLQVQEHAKAVSIMKEHATPQISAHARGHATAACGTAHARGHTTAALCLGTRKGACHRLLLCLSTCKGACHSSLSLGTCKGACHRLLLCIALPCPS